MGRHAVGGRSATTPRIWSTDTVSGSNSASHHVAPARPYGTRSVPGGNATAMSNGSFPVAQAGERVGEFGDLVGVAHVDGEEPVVPGGAPHGYAFAGESRRPHRHARSLHRPWQEPDVDDGVVLTPVVDFVARP